jgi:hypothetical protein
MGKVNRRTNEQWRRILAACEASGLTQEQWREEHNVNINTLRDRATRLHRLDERAEELLAERRSGWVEVKNEEPPPDNIATGALTIEFDGFRLTADALYPAASLAALLRELARPC